MKISKFFWCIFFIHGISGGSIGRQHACPSSTLDNACATLTNNGGSASGWYDVDKEYTYNFKIIQENAVYSEWGVGYGRDAIEDNEDEDGENNPRASKDSQALVFEGTMEVKRNVDCTASFIVSNATVTVSEVDGSGTGNPQPLLLPGLTKFPPPQHGEGCANPLLAVPDEEENWKTNLRKALYLLLISPSTRDNNDLFRISIDENQEATMTLGFNDTESTISTSSLVSIVDNQFYSDIMQGIMKSVKGHFENATNVEQYKDKSSLENQESLLKFYKKELATFSNYRLQACLATAVGLQVKNKKCKEIQAIGAHTYLATKVRTSAEITLAHVQSLNGHNSKAWEVAQQMSTKLVASNLDGLETDSMDPATREHFRSLTARFCEYIRNSEDMLVFGEKMRHILPLIPKNNIEEAYQTVKHLPCNGSLTTEAFLDTLASARTDSVVSFMIDLITKGDKEIEDDTFDMFLTTATLNQAADNSNFDKYASTNAVVDMEKLLDIQRLHHERFGMSDKDFLLHMAGFVRNINPNATVVASFSGKLLTFAHALNVDTATYLQILRAMDTLPQNIQLNKYERLAVYNPCDGGHELFLKDIMNGPSHPGDLKVMAYLFMRKCYIPEWRKLIKEYVLTEGGNVEVKKFITHHIMSISESYSSLSVSEDAEILNSTDELGEEGEEEKKSLYGFTKAKDSGHMELQIYGSPFVAKPQESFQFNYVKGDSMIPRMVSVNNLNFGNDGTTTSFDIEIVRIESSLSKDSEILITVKSNGVAFYTKTFKWDQSKILQLLEDSYVPTSHFIKYVQEIGQKFLQGVFKDSQRDIGPISHRVFPSMSGFPIISRSTWEGVVSMNPITTKSGLSFAFSPSIIGSMGESVSVGFGHSNVLGYSLASKILFNVNVEVALKKIDKGSYFLKFGFSNPKPDDEEELNNGFQFQVELFNLRRFKMTDSYTKVEQTGHIWIKDHSKVHALPNNDTAVLERELEIETMSYDFAQHSKMLENRSCSVRYSQNILFSRSKLPLYILGDVFCDIPSIYLEGHVLREDENTSMSIKLYPEGQKDVAGNIAATLKSYDFKVGLSKGCSKKGVKLSLSSPSNDMELTVQLERNFKHTNHSNHYLLLMGSKDGAKMGLRFYDEKNATTTPSNSSTNTEESRSEVRRQFGLRLWTPFSGYETIKILHGELSKTGYDKPQESARIHSLVLESEGIHRALDSQVQVFTTEIVRSEMGVVNGSFEAENEMLGKIGFKTNVNIIDTVNDNPKFVGMFELAYGREVWETVAGNFEAYKKYQQLQSLKEEQREGWELTSKISVKADIRMSEYPQYDFNISGTHHRYRDIVRTDSGCDQVYEDVTKIVGVLKDQSSKVIEVSHLVHYDDSSCLQIKNTFHNATVLLPGDNKLNIAVAFDKNERTSNAVDVGLRLHTALMRTDMNYHLNENSKPHPECHVYAKIQLTRQLIYEMDHKLVKISQDTVKYEGSISAFPPGVNLEMNGILLVSTPQSWFTYKNVEINILERDEKFLPLLLTYKNGQHVESRKYTVDLQATTTKQSYLQKSLTLYSDKNPVKLLSAASAIYGLYDLKVDIDKTMLSFVLVNHIRESTKTTGEISWPTEIRSNEQIEHFTANLTLGEINDEDPVYTFYATSSLTRMDGEPPQKSLTNFLSRSFEVVPPPNYRYNLKSEFKAFDESYRCNISAELLPHEEKHPNLEITYAFGDPEQLYYLGYHTQFFYNKSWTSTISHTTDMTIGNWLTMQKPHSADFIVESMWKISQVDKITKDSLADKFYEKDLSLVKTFRFAHRQFFCENLDTDFQSNVKVSLVGANLGPQQLEATGETDVYNFTRTCNFEVTLKADGDQSLPEVHFETGYDWQGSQNHSKAFYKLKYDLGNQVSHNVTVSYVGMKENTQATENGETEEGGGWGRMRKWLASHLNNRKTELEWKWSGSNDLTSPVLMFEDEDRLQTATGKHKFHQFFGSWKDMELSAQHKVSSGYGNLNWEDKIYSNYSLTNEGSCGISSSKMFSVTSAKGAGSGTAAVNILYPMLRSRLTTSWNQTIPTENDATSKTGGSISMNSVLLNNPLQLSCSYGVFPSTSGNKYDTAVIFNTLRGAHYNVKSVKKEHIGVRINDELFSDYVTHALNYSFTYGQPEDWYHSVFGLDWHSVAVVLRNPSNLTVFMHYDNLEQHYQGTEPNRNNPLTISTSFSASAPLPDDPQIMQLMTHSHKVSASDDTDINDKFYEAMLRMGSLHENSSGRKGTDCQEQKPGILSGSLANTTSLSSQDFEGLKNYKLNCGRCRHSQSWTDMNDLHPLTCSSGTGHFLLHKITNNDTFNPLDINVGKADSIENGENKIIQALWSQDSQCRAEYSESVVSEWYPSSEKSGDLSDQCSLSLKEMNPCFTKPLSTKCNKSYGARQLKLWSKLTSSITPMTMSSVGDTFGLIQEALGLML